MAVVQSSSEFFVKDKTGHYITIDDGAEIKYKDFLPSWELDKTLPPLEFKEHIDKGTLADPAFPNLFPKGKEFTQSRITPKLGTEITGVQLSQLDDDGKNELALLVAQRGLVVFRDQDFADFGPQFAVDYGRYFGPLHIHPTSGAPKGFPELHVVYRNEKVAVEGFSLEKETNVVRWHSDVSYELQPPGVTIFSVLEGPETGGDTLFSDTVEAYDRLSDEFKKRLEGLYVEHSSQEQAQFSLSRGGIARREAVKNIHPLVRVHPVTGKKILYVNPGFTRRIIGYKKQESDNLLKFLFDHIGNSHDLQARAVWKPKTVVAWDNRRVAHTALLDWDAEQDATRLAVRITPQAERPVADLKDLNKEDYNRLAKDVDEKLRF